MKTFIKILVLTLIIVSSAYSQWQPDVRLTNNPAASLTSFNNARCIAASGDSVHVAWLENRNGNYEIYYKRSTDGGLSWGADTRLTNNSAASYEPSVTVSGQVVHVVWYDGRDGNMEIYYKRDPTGNSIGIQIISSEIPKEFKLGQNYPNPFNPTTVIRYSLIVNSDVNLRVYDILGQETAVLVNEKQQPGTYETEWNASNYPSGIYFYKLSTGEFSQTRKAVLIK